MKLYYIEFLREIGIYFSVNRMLAAECYKQRMEKGLTFFELNYMIMQSYDFLVLNRKYGCVLQLGGDDQWSNILGGVSLTRRADGKEAYGMTFNLLLNSEGNKMGKTEKGAVWLDPQKTPPYEFYQYWRNVDDADVIKCLKKLTFIPVSQIIKYEKLEGSELNPIKEMLAYEVTKLIHGEDEAEKARNAAKALFSSGADSSDMPTTALSDDDFEDGGALITAVMVKAGIAKSRGDARRLIEQGGVMIDDEKLADFAYRIPRERLESGHIIIKKGKKVFHKIKI